MNQITHAAFVAAFVAKHGVHPSAFKMEKRGDVWKAKMEVLDSLAQVPEAPTQTEGGSERGCFPGPADVINGVDPSIYCLIERATPGAIGADSIVAFANHNHAFATEA